LDDQIVNARYRPHQIVCLFEFASTQLHIELADRDVAHAFEVSHRVVARAELRGYDGSPARRRRRELSDGCEQELIKWIANKMANHRAVNQTELLHECTERFGKNICEDRSTLLDPAMQMNFLKPKAFRKKIRSLK
jgi:AraC-like DNA-binding protein